MREKVALKGRLTVELREADGRVVSREVIENLVVTAGKQALLSASSPAGLTDWDYLAIGTSSTPAAAGQTALVAEVARAQGTLSNPDANTLRLAYTFPAGVGTGTIWEYGRFNADTDGIMLCRTIGGEAKVKGAGQTLAVVWDLAFS
jgi:hypothetical protein